MAPIQHHVSTQLEGTVIVSDSPPTEEGVQSHYPSIENGQSNAQDGVVEVEDPTLQACWTEAMKDEMGIPQGYLNVAVLIIKWCKELDTLNCEEEVQQLHNLFSRSDLFNFKVTRLELDNREWNPQHQLKEALGTFLKVHDGPYNQLIIYYSGHGGYSSDDPNSLLFYASDSEFQVGPPNRYPAIVSWASIENILKDKDVLSDILVILDTCFAGDLHKGSKQEVTKIFEVLAAGGHERTTATPASKRSFTKAVIRQLHKLLDEYGPGKQFSSDTLQRYIKLDPHRRTNPPDLFPIIPQQSEPHVLLGRLQHSGPERANGFKKVHPKSYVTLRVALSDSVPDKDHVEKLARALSKAAKNSEMKVQSIDWLGHRLSPMQHFQSSVAAARLGRRWLHQARTSHSPAGLPKRRRCEGTEECETNSQKRLCADDSGMLEGSRVSEVPNTPESTRPTISESE